MWARVLATFDCVVGVGTMWPKAPPRQVGSVTEGVVGTLSVARSEEWILAVLLQQPIDRYLSSGNCARPLEEYTRHEEPMLQIGIECIHLNALLLRARGVKLNVPGCRVVTERCAV